MGSHISCSCKKRNMIENYGAQPLDFDADSLDDTFMVRDDIINRISILTRDRNIIDKEDGRPTIIAHKYSIDSEAIHCGSFGCVYGCTDVSNPIEIERAHQTSQYKYAAKVEDFGIIHGDRQLKHESRVYIALEGGKGIPHMYAYEEDSRFGVLVIDMLGPSLKQLWLNCGGSFSVKTVLMCAEQMLDTVQFIHERYFVHRDLKPDNFAVGLPGSEHEEIIFSLDFGLAKRWKNFKTRELRPFIKRYKGLVGTELFASRAAHDGWEQGRKDDLECLGYIFLYLLGMLPWSQKLIYERNPNLERNANAYFDELHNLKRNLPLEKYGKNIPKEFIKYLEYVRNLDYAMEPNYDYLRNLLRHCAKTQVIPYPYDNKFDWMSRKSISN